ncbi:hypothetical protein JSE7799_03342 [Jannaschia seosinensis]|uniref:Proteophosphoglycan n=1 Tax=Jannaschia seosinensis TaxID=313367 RepID=A0A0M7BCS7_9RHOB|nr:DUF1285 domain-containing protein [Jannaschia seosinensis]CUH40607.1 hypothetical protein JSE7799_03342 [Jannaschia seosinensis]
MAEHNEIGGPAASLLQAAQAHAGSNEGKRGTPPVHLWNPDYCGEIDILIRRDGTWIHEGTPIGRPGLVRLFASILKREDDRHYLVTPVEKLGIRVEDAPFVAVDFETGDGAITFTTNVGDTVTAGPDHPIRVEMAADGEPSPYVEVRRGLEALIDRKSFYRLVELGEERDGQFGVASDGAFFPIIDAAALPD